VEAVLEEVEMSDLEAREVAVRVVVERKQAAAVLDTVALALTEVGEA
jgi:hypothetical protein